MHDPEVVSHAVRLAAEGHSATEIARATGCSRSTVRGWIGGAVPGRGRSVPHPCVRCGGAHVDPAEAGGAYVYLLGVYLGDGCISVHPRGVTKLRLFFDVRYPGLIEASRGALAVVAPRNRVGSILRSGGGFEGSAHGSNIELTVYSKAWPCLFPQHGPGRKHERPIVLADWQERLVDEHVHELIRGLIHSDGCRFVNTGRNWSHPRYSFSNRSADIRGIFCDACDRLDLRWTVAPHTVYVSRKADVASLDAFVGPKT